MVLPVWPCWQSNPGSWHPEIDRRFLQPPHDGRPAPAALAGDARPCRPARGTATLPQLVGPARSESQADHVNAGWIRAYRETRGQA